MKIEADQKSTLLTPLFTPSSEVLSGLLTNDIVMHKAPSILASISLRTSLKTFT
jgi:hypothetical protein